MIVLEIESIDLNELANKKKSSLRHKFATFSRKINSHFNLTRVFRTSHVTTSDLEKIYDESSPKCQEVSEKSVNVSENFDYNFKR